MADLVIPEALIPFFRGMVIDQIVSEAAVVESDYSELAYLTSVGHSKDRIETQRQHSDSAREELDELLDKVKSLFDITNDELLNMIPHTVLNNSRHRFHIPGQCPIPFCPDCGY